MISSTHKKNIHNYIYIEDVNLKYEFFENLIEYFRENRKVPLYKQFMNMRNDASNEEKCFINVENPCLIR